MIQEKIRERIISELEPSHLEVENESHMHSGPATESHFRVVVVSTSFEVLSRVDRHRKVNGLVMDLFKEGLHAFSVLPYSPEEWKKKGGADLQASPACSGAKK